MTETMRKPEILTADETLLAIFQKALCKHGIKPGRGGWRSIKTWGTFSSRDKTPLLVALMLEDMDNEKARWLRQLGNRTKYYLLFKGKLPSRAVADRITWLDVRDERRVHYVVTEKERPEDFADRLIGALESGTDDGRILDAWWEESTLVVVSVNNAGFRKLRIPLQKLPALPGSKSDELSRFEIDEDGLFLHWPDYDVHLGWDQFEQAVDEKAYLQAKMESDVFRKRYGTAIKALRNTTGLKQREISGLTARQIGRIESGECRATRSALVKLAEAHHMSVDDYLHELAELL